MNVGKHENSQKNYTSKNDIFHSDLNCQKNHLDIMFFLDNSIETKYPHFFYLDFWNQPSQPSNKCKYIKASTTY